MASSASTVSLTTLDHFTLFPNLPDELRVMIWRFTFLPRIVEILASEYCTGGFYSRAPLPVAFHISKESRHEVELFYSTCFGSFLQPARTLFNFNIDTLYLDIALEEDCLHRLFGILKQEELSQVKCIAIDETYLYLDPNGSTSGSTTSGLRKAIEAMTSLKEMILVREVENESRPASFGREPKVQIKFCNDATELGRIDEGWVGEAGDLGDAEVELRGWRLGNGVKQRAVYGWRTV